MLIGMLLLISGIEEWSLDGSAEQSTERTNDGTLRMAADMALSLVAAVFARCSESNEGRVVAAVKDRSPASR